MDLARFRGGAVVTLVPRAVAGIPAIPVLCSEPQPWQGSRVINGAGTTKFYPLKCAHHCPGTCEHNETFPDASDCRKTLVFTRATARREQLDELEMKFK